MRKIILASISILIFSLCSFAQSKEILPCPSGVSVTGPSGLVKPGDEHTFAAKVDNPGNRKIEYNWSVSGGEIIEGQGTPTIKVFQIEESVIATLEISDLSGDCSNLSGSETTVICECATSTLVDELSPPSSKNLDQEIKNRLDNFAVTLLNNPNATGFILGKFGENISESSMKAKLNKIVDYLIKVRDFDKSQLTIATAESDDEEGIQFWLVPAGAMPPTP